MPYGVSYTSSYRKYKSCTRTPYDDWINKNKPEVVFKYSTHGMDEYAHIYFEPMKNLITIEADMEYYYFEVKFTIKIDDEKKKLEIDRFFCKSDNFWPEMFTDGTPNSGSGGISWYKKNIAFLPDFLSLENAIDTFFGSEWKIQIPLTRPLLSDTKEVSYDDYFDNYRCGPWDHTIGIFVLNKNEAATIIQKYYRGWRVRMKYRYDPETRLGKYVINKMFKELI